MKNKKTIALTLIGLFIFLFGVIGITYAYWQLTLKQTDENLVYTDCLKITTSLTNEGHFSLNTAYPMTNEELVKDFFPNQEPYHFTIENQCDNEVPISINMESLTTIDPQLKDDYVDVILWESETTEKFNLETDTVLSHKDSTDESKYRLIDNAENKSMIADNAKKAYQLYKFKLPGKKEDGSTNHIKQFNLLLFMDYATPVDGTIGEDGLPIHTNNAHWEGKITLNNYELPKVKIGGIEVELAESGDGLYEVDHSKDDGTTLAAEWKVNPEYRYAGANPDNYVWFNCEEGNSGNTCEKWRIIGLVNVKTTSGEIEQRLKIISQDNFNMSWDSSSNDWTQASSMTYLNSGEYYTTKLKAQAQGMIAEDIIWNIGGWSTASVKTAAMYGYERGTKTGNSDTNPSTWPAYKEGSYENITARFGLMYPSDFGYAVGGTKENRTECLKTELYNYGDGCYEYDWLTPTSSWTWTISPNSSNSNYAFLVGSSGYFSCIFVYLGGGVAPVVYLASNVKIADGHQGTVEDPYILEAE